MRSTKLCFDSPLGVVLGLACILLPVISLHAQNNQEQIKNVATKNESSKRSAIDNTIREKLNQNHTFSYDSVPFSDVQSMLRKQLKMNVVIDPNLEGVLDEDTEVSANLVNIRLADGLRTMLRCVDATFVVKDGLLLIISVDDENEPEYLVRQMVDVSDLLVLLKQNKTDQQDSNTEVLVVEPVESPSKSNEAAFGGSGALPTKTVVPKSVAAKSQPTVDDELINTITEIVCSDSWTRNGSGNGEIRIIGGVLVFTNSEKVRDDVLTLVKDLKYQIKSRIE